MTAKMKAQEQLARQLLQALRADDHEATKLAVDALKKVLPKKVELRYLGTDLFLSCRSKEAHLFPEGVSYALVALLCYLDCVGPDGEKHVYKDRHPILHQVP